MPSSDTKSAAPDMGVGCGALLGWDVKLYEMSCVVFAKSAAQARWLAVKGWRDAGYGGRRQWPTVSARRNPRYDGFYRKTEGRCWTPEYVRDLTAA